MYFVASIWYKSIRFAVWFSNIRCSVCRSFCLILWTSRYAFRNCAFCSTVIVAMLSTITDFYCSARLYCGRVGVHHFPVIHHHQRFNGIGILAIFAYATSTLRLLSNASTWMNCRAKDKRTIILTETHSHGGNGLPSRWHQTILFVKIGLSIYTRPLNVYLSLVVMSDLFCSGFGIIHQNSLNPYIVCNSRWFDYSNDVYSLI